MNSTAEVIKRFFTCHTFTFDEFNTFIEFVPNSHKDFFNFMYYTGCRPGEVFALTWDEYDGSTININKSLSRKVINGGYLLKSPKNESSIRTIDLSENIIEMFDNRKAHEEKNTVLIISGSCLAHINLSQKLP